MQLESALTNLWSCTSSDGDLPTLTTNVLVDAFLTSNTCLLEGSEARG